MITPGSAIAVVLAVLAGISIATQQVFNGGLRNAIGSVWWAGLASYLGGTAFMIAALLVTRTSIPTAASLRLVTAIQWTGGILGGVYIILSLFALPRLGVALVLTLVVVGQMTASMTFDQFGLFGVPQHSASLTRIARGYRLGGRRVADQNWLEAQNIFIEAALATGIRPTYFARSILKQHPNSS